MLIISSFTDSQKYIKGCGGKLLYFISVVILQKPLLLPIIFPHYVFKSVPSKNEIPLREHVRVRPLGRFIQMHSSKFVLSAQEMNFISSFSFSGIISIVTTCNLVHIEKEGKVEEFIVFLKIYCIVYTCFSLILTFFLYGRKAHKAEKSPMEVVK